MWVNWVSETADRGRLDKDNPKHPLHKGRVHKGHLRGIQHKDDDINGHSILLLLDKKEFRRFR